MEKQMDTQQHKCLIAYFSRAGYNYVDGKIIGLAVGNTEVVAQLIGNETGGDLMRILPQTEYPADYHETTDVAKQELAANARPALALAPGSIEDYDIVFLGYPNWWGTMPMPVWTFLERYDFSDKTIIPFCTHEGSGMGRSERDIAALCPQARLKKGLAIQGSNVGSAGPSVKSWIGKLKI